MYLKPVPSRFPVPRPRRSSALHAALVFLLSLAVLGVPCLLLRPAQESAGEYQAVSPPSLTAQAPFVLPGNVTAGLPEGAHTGEITFSAQRLRSGRLMLVDRQHPLPEDAAPPSTFNLLARSHGTVACRDLQAVLGEDAISALEALFAAARQNHINLFTVFRASLSAAQQKELQIQRFCQLANALPLEDAFRQALLEISPAGASEHQTAWAVDIRICDGWNQLPRSEPLSASPEGQWLLDNCWRYGFIHRYPESDPSPDPSCGAYHFRYVGLAHASMMRALDLTLEDYLSLLHSQETLTLWEDDKPVCSVLCRTVEDTLAVQAPMAAQLEDVSLDNLGWGVAAYLWPVE